MKIGIVSDIHCNAPALREALDRLGQTDALLCLGDAIDQHRFSNEVVALLREREAIAIQGNHEAVFFSPAGARARASADIDPSHLQWLAAQPDRRHQQLGTVLLWMVHGAPWQVSGYARADDPRFAAALATSPADILLCGHTHQPVVRRLGDKLLLNPGSLGEGRPEPGGFVRSCAWLDLITHEARIIDLPNPRK